jgi:precorrin-6B methylase 1
MECSQLVVNRVEDASRPLREEVASLNLLLARIGMSLEPMEVCSSGGKKLATVQASLLLGYN